MNLSESYKNRLKSLAGLKGITYKGIDIIQDGNLWIVQTGIKPEFAFISDAKDWIDKRIEQQNQYSHDFS